MKDTVIIFGEKWGSAERVKKIGYEPVLVHYERRFLENFILVTQEESLAGSYNLQVFEKFRRHDVKGLIVCSDFYVELAAQVRERYFPHLKGLSRKQAITVRDKMVLKKRLREFEIQTANFVELTSVSSFHEVVETLGSPFLIKPRKGVSARGVWLVGSEMDWHCWREGRTTVDAFYAEEYLKNVREYCCDTVVADGRILGQFPGEYTVTCLESSRRHDGYGVNFPGFLPLKTIEEMKALTRQFIQALDIRDAFCHTEFFYDLDDGAWKFGEIGCRLPGGYQIPTESYIAQTNILDLYLKIFIETEETPSQPIKTDGRYFGYYLSPKKSGKVKSVEADLDLPWMVESKIYVKPGDFLAHEDSSTAMSAHAVYNADSIEELGERAMAVRDLVKIEYE